MFYITNLTSSSITSIAKHNIQFGVQMCLIAYKIEAVHNPSINIHIEAKSPATPSPRYKHILSTGHGIKVGVITRSVHIYTHTRSLQLASARSDLSCAKFRGFRNQLIGGWSLYSLSLSLSLERYCRASYVTLASLSRASASRD